MFNGKTMAFNHLDYLNWLQNFIQEILRFKIEVGGL